MKRSQHILIITCFALNLMGQQLDIRIGQEVIKTELVSYSDFNIVLKMFSGNIDPNLYKEWTKNSYLLQDSTILIELYDGSGVRINNNDDFYKLSDVRFVKNYIYNLKKNVSYKYEIESSRVQEMLRTAKQLSFESERPDLYSYKVYQLSSDHILFFLKSDDNDRFLVYPDLKTLAADDQIIPNAGNSEILEQLYNAGSSLNNEETWAELLVGGETMADHESKEFLVQSSKVTELKKNHKLTLIEEGVKTQHYYLSNLYESEYGHFIAISNLDGDSGQDQFMDFQFVELYASLEEVKAKEKLMSSTDTAGVTSEHMYEYISSTFGPDFPNTIDSLVQVLPDVLNFNKRDLSFDIAGMNVVNEAIRWNHDKWKEFDQWFPSVLAFYGKCYNANKEKVKWVTKTDSQYGVVIPYLVNYKDEVIFDPNEFYKVLLEWPNTIQWAGDWNGFKKRLVESRKNR